MEDLISRQAALDALYHAYEYNGRSVQAIRNLPSAERHGRWEYFPTGNYKCSVCGAWYSVDGDEPLGFNYCPNCGTSMVDGEQDG